MQISVKAFKSLECHEDIERIYQLVNKIFKTRCARILFAGIAYSQEWLNTFEAAPQCKEDIFHYIAILRIAGIHSTLQRNS